MVKATANFLFLFYGVFVNMSIKNGTSSVAKYLLSQSEVLDRPGFQFVYDKMGPSVLIPTNKTFLHILDSKFYDWEQSMVSSFYANIIWENNADFFFYYDPWSESIPASTYG